jgi:hypothetical protein
MPGPPGVVKTKQEWIASIEAEIDRLQRARDLLAGGTSGGRRQPARKGHVMSPEAREKIAAAQRKTWAKAKKAAK